MSCQTLPPYSTGYIWVPAFKYRMIVRSDDIISPAKTQEASRTSLPRTARLVSSSVTPWLADIFMVNEGNGVLIWCSQTNQNIEKPSSLFNPSNIRDAALTWDAHLESVVSDFALRAGVFVIINDIEWYSALHINAAISNLRLWGNVGSPLFLRKLDEPAQEQSSEGVEVGNQDHHNAHFRERVVVKVVGSHICFLMMFEKTIGRRDLQLMALTASRARDAQQSQCRQAMPIVTKGDLRKLPRW
jgi:hypothetical protein